MTKLTFIPFLSDNNKIEGRNHNSKKSQTVDPLIEFVLFTIKFSVVNFLRKMIL